MRLTTGWKHCAHRSSSILAKHPQVSPTSTRIYKSRVTYTCPKIPSAVGETLHKYSDKHLGNPSSLPGGSAVIPTYTVSLDDLLTAASRLRFVPRPTQMDHPVYLVIYQDTTVTISGVYANLDDANAECLRSSDDAGKDLLAQRSKRGPGGDALTDVLLRWDSPDGISCWVEKHDVVQAGGASHKQ